MKIVNIVHTVSTEYFFVVSTLLYTHVYVDKHLIHWLE